MNAPTPRYTGTMHKGADGIIRGTLRDSFLWPIDFTATRQPDGTYALDGVLGPTPDAFKIDGIDE